MCELRKTYDASPTELACNDHITEEMRLLHPHSQILVSERGSDHFNLFGKDAAEQLFVRVAAKC